MARAHAAPRLCLTASLLLASACGGSRLEGTQPTPVQSGAGFVRYLPDADVIRTDPPGSDTPTLETCYFGLFDGVSQGNLSQLHSVERETGKKPAMVMWYIDWSTPFPTSASHTLWQAGYVPHITWEAWRNRSMTSVTHAGILAGEFDAYIDQFGKDAAAWGQPVFVRFGHEMNGDWYPWCSYVNGQTPQSFIRTFRYVHDRVVAAGATNVLWVWCPNNSGTDDPAGITASYPGDDYVDWVGVDFYNWGTSQPWSRWLPAVDILRAPYEEIRRVAPGKPMMVGEMGTTPSGGDKAAWIAAFLPALRLGFPNVRAVVWFNIDKETDWRFDDTDADLAAFRTGIRDPYFLTSGANLASAHTRFRPR